MPQFGIASGLPSYPSGLEDKDAGLVLPLYRSVNGLAQRLSEATGQVQYNAGEMAQVDQFSKLIDSRTNKLMIRANVNLSYGRLVNLFIAADGKVVGRLANATTLRQAHAIVDTVGGIAVGEYGEVIFLRGKSSGIGGTTFGTTYYLSINGLTTATAPVATGALHQAVGMGLGSAGFYLDIQLVARVPSYVYQFSPTVVRTLYADGSYTDVNV